MSHWQSLPTDATHNRQSAPLIRRPQTTHFDNLIDSLIREGISIAELQLQFVLVLQFCICLNGRLIKQLNDTRKTDSNACRHLHAFILTFHQISAITNSYIVTHRDTLNVHCVHTNHKKQILKKISTRIQNNVTMYSTFTAKLRCKQLTITENFESFYYIIRNTGHVCHCV